MAADGVTGALVQSSSGGISFQQQGTVDWTVLGGGTITFSLGVLRRFSEANLDAYTVAVGYVLGGQFKLSRHGRLNIDKAIKQMRAYAGFQDVMWFGFGMQHPARAIAVKEQGATMVGLCAALSEGFQTLEAAEILNEMVQLHASADATPALSQWESLVKSCAGILSTTNFPLRAERIMGFDWEGSYRAQKPPSPIGIAKALNAVAKVSRGEWLTITIYGNREARWIAALAEWFFELSTKIYDDSGKLIYMNCPDNQIPQITIYPVKASNNNILEIGDKTFYIGKVDDILKPEVPAISGRVPWDICLEASFGQIFLNLMQRPSQIGRVFSCIAELLEVFALKDAGIYGKEYDLYLEDSYGEGFLQTLINSFPELSPIRSFLNQDPSVRGAEETIASLKSSINIIEKICSCSRCTRAGERPRDCLVALIETISKLCLLKSCTVCPDELFPKRSGLRLLYNKMLQRSPTISWDINFTITFLMANLKNRVDELLTLFTGRKLPVDPYKIGTPPVAPVISVNGICIYLDALRGIPETIPQFALLHICSGSIEYRGKPFSSVKDHKDLIPQMNRGISKANSFFIRLQNKTDMHSAKLIVRETITELQIYYSILDSKGNPTGLTLEPGSLCSILMRIYRGISCSHPYSSDLDPSSLSPETEALIEQNNLRVIYFEDRSLLAQCAVLMGKLALGDFRFLPSDPILQPGSCLECCVKWAMKENGEIGPEKKTRTALIIGSRDNQLPPL